MEHDVFISYSSIHKDAANAICHLLEANDIRCWMAPRDIQGGQQYGDVIEEAIKSARVCVLVFSKAAQESQWVNAEINVAFEQGKTIIPYRVEDTPIRGQIKLMLNQKHWIDAYPDYKDKFNELIESVSTVLAMSKISNKSFPVKNPHRCKTIKILVYCVISIIFIIGAVFAVTCYVQPSQSQISYERNNNYYTSFLSTQKLTETDMAGKTKEELQEMRNYIYAKNGYKFKKKKLYEYFSHFDWYTPTTDDAEIVFKKMSKIEQDNVLFIRKYELNSNASN